MSAGDLLNPCPLCGGGVDLSGSGSSVKCRSCLYFAAFRCHAALGELAKRAAATLEERLRRIREAGWAVAVHNDYRLNGVPHTFWLFTKGGMEVGLAARGEGLSDAIALNQVEAKIRTVQP